MPCNFEAAMTDQLSRTRTGIARHVWDRIFIERRRQSGEERRYNKVIYESICGYIGYRFCFMDISFREEQIYSGGNMMIQEFQHFVEFQLIQVMIGKMLLIQFESIVNWIQMKLMKGSNKMKNMMIQEFQHFVEFQLIEMMKMKIHVL
jgi:hypothetical protein